MSSSSVLNRKRAGSPGKYREQDAEILDVLTDSFQLSSAESTWGKAEGLKLTQNTPDIFSDIA